ncbi:SRPBCC family protein [Pannonibacter sp. Q-1]|uniref:Carbon monoxide dehydrogenase n=1 Tax=Pannonibacter phragmitetus TaxID=121719 RepID=A0A0U3P355_9HYPH|nr:MULTISPECIES: carbon monoxide dehydrogenase subunit G [Pannonibacter]ALV26245.1 carbon monoxide dehydrogenase [Pannonibacter phragmitetus]MBA4206621.1 adenylosuccinate lyase [Polymorphum sp.]
MDMTGEYRIPAPRTDVWNALNDPDVLKACIPGCESLEMTSPTEMTAAVTAKIGPVKAKFQGAVTLENLNPPESYTIAGEGKGGVAGFAKGSADVHLAEDGGDTILTYTVKAQVGGKLAQLGSRLIDSTARKMADEFFGNFSQMVAGNAAATGTAEDGEPDAGTLEEARSIAMEQAGDAVVHAVEDVEKTIGHAVHEAEETVEAAAVKGSFGGPVVWGLAALAAIIVILAIMSR